MRIVVDLVRMPPPGLLLPIQLISKPRNLFKLDTHTPEYLQARKSFIFVIAEGRVPHNAGIHLHHGVLLDFYQELVRLNRYVLD